jgi:hypothetical protein
MARKKAAKKLVKGKKLERTKPLTEMSIPFTKVEIKYTPQN